MTRLLYLLWSELSNSSFSGWMLISSTLQAVSWLPNILTITGKRFDKQPWASVSNSVLMLSTKAIKYGLGRHIADVDQSKIITFGVVRLFFQSAF